MEELISKIEQAFIDVPYPGDKDLTRSTYGEEPAALVKEFRGKQNWQKLDAEFLNQAPDGWGTALCFFSNNAFQFYLAAYLIADIQGCLDLQDPTVRLCMSLTPLGEKQKIAKVWGGGTMGTLAREEFDCYDAQKVSAIVAYLWWKLESLGGYDDIIEQALEHYWIAREDSSYKS